MLGQNSETQNIIIPKIKKSVCNLVYNFLF